MLRQVRTPSTSEIIDKNQVAYTVKRQSLTLPALKDMDSMAVSFAPIKSSTSLNGYRLRIYRHLGPRQSPANSGQVLGKPLIVRDPGSLHAGLT